MEVFIRLMGASEGEVYFLSVHSQGELDLMIVKDGRRLGFEFKYADSPGMTSAGRMALEVLKLDQLTFVCPGSGMHELDDRVHVRGLSRMISEKSP